MVSRLPPVIKTAKKIHRQLHNVLTFFTHRITNAVVLRNYWRRALHHVFSAKRLRTRWRRCEQILVMQAGQDQFNKHEFTRRRQSMSGF